MKKKDIILLIITITFLLTLVGVASFAYFAGSASEDTPAEFSTQLPERGVFTSYSTNPLSLSLVESDFASASTSAKKSDTGNIIIEYLSNTTNNAMFCTYDIRLVWDSENQYINPTLPLPYNTSYKFEWSILGTRSTSDASSGHSYVNKNFSEVNLTDLSWTGEDGVIGRYATLVDDAEIYNKSNKTASKTTWTFTMKFYVLPADQDFFENKTFDMHLELADVIC